MYNDISIIYKYYIWVGKGNKSFKNDLVKI